jgi:hypothetical protein
MKIRITKDCMILNDVAQDYHCDAGEVLIFPDDCIEVVDESCTWKYDDIDNTYTTTCRHAWEFTTGTVEENELNFCPFCGKRITVSVGKEVRACEDWGLKKLVKNNSSDLCKCGHPEKRHIVKGSGCTVFACPCQKFEPAEKEREELTTEELIKKMEKAQKATANSTLRFGTEAKKKKQQRRQKWISSMLQRLMRRNGLMNL